MIQGVGCTVGVGRGLARAAESRTVQNKFDSRVVADFHARRQFL